MNDGWAGFTVGFFVALALVFVFCVVRVRSIDESFENVASKVVVYERYNPLDLKSKKAAIDKCDKLLESNGYTLSGTDNEMWADGEYLVVVGKKKEVK